MAKWIIDRTINLDYPKTKRVLELLLIEPRKEDSDLEKVLMKEGVLKSGSDGALRRRWYTYLRNYGFLAENQVTEIGKMYANGCFSLQEIALLQLFKRKLRFDTGETIVPFKIVVGLFDRLLSNEGLDNAYLTQAEFSNYIVNLKDDSEETIEQTYILIRNNRTQQELDVVAGEHTDIWFNNIKQTGIFQIYGKGLFLEEENLDLFKEIANAYKSSSEVGNFMRFDSQLIKNIPLYTLRSGYQVNITSSASNILRDYLINGLSINKLAEKYYRSSSENLVVDVLNSFGVDENSNCRGIYRPYREYPGIIAQTLKSNTEPYKTVGKLIEKTITHDEEIEIQTNDIEELIIQKYNEMNLKQMEKEIPSLYEEFRNKFSPEALQKLNDDDLARYMFYSEKNNKENMCWNLEFNPKVKEYFGAIGGGTAYLYGLFYNQKLKSWVTGTSQKPVLLDEAGATSTAKDIRQILTDAIDIVAKYQNAGSVLEYAEMHKELVDNLGGIVNKIWFKKYLHMMFPSLFPTYYTENWQRYLLKKCNLTQHDDGYERAGELSLLGKRVEIENSVLAKVLFELFGYPTSDEELEEIEELDNKEEKKSMVVRTPRTNRTHPLNAIVYGAPGTGKTYSMKEYAVAIVDGRKVRTEQLTDSQRQELNEKYKKLVADGQVVFTTFHQSYGYEDFIQGLRPETTNGAMDFVPVDGVFKRIADKAMQDTTNNYVIIIDEINRGNISKVFGELITLIEDDKRWGEKEQLSVILPSGQEFAVPNNLYIVGTMNSADKSIALIDTALRRRFDFIEVAPNTSLVADDTLRKVLEQLNAVLRKELDSSDLLIGHAYFIGKSAEELASIMNRNIIPLLYEYFYDNEKKVKDALVKALDGTDVKLKDNNQGRIRVE